jgi:hypothetical protein
VTQINVAVMNNTSENQNVHVYDQFANGQREVSSSSFGLVANEQSAWFGVNASDNGGDVIENCCDGGPSLPASMLTRGR